MGAQQPRARSHLSLPANERGEGLGQGGQIWHPGGGLATRRDEGNRRGKLDVAWRCTEERRHPEGTRPEWSEGTEITYGLNALQPGHGATFASKADEIGL